MSAPETNITTQKRRHWGPLIGMAVGLLFVAGLIVFWPYGDSTAGVTPAGFEAAIEEPRVPAGDTQTVLPENSVPEPNSGSISAMPPAVSGAGATP